MAKVNFDLGMKYDGPCCAPTCCSDSKEPEVHYPTFNYDGKEKLDVPDEGVMTIRYKKTHSSMSESERSGKRYSCCVEVREVISAEGGEVEAPSKRNKDAEESLDKLMADKKAKAEDY